VRNIGSKSPTRRHFSPLLAYSIEYQLLIPETDDKSEKKRKSSLKSLIALKETIHSTVDIQFEKAIETGNFI